MRRAGEFGLALLMALPIMYHVDGGWWVSFAIALASICLARSSCRP
jgi:hypothetical protein